MLKNLVLRRPLAVLDLETTGTDPQTARVVEVSALKLHPGGRRGQRIQSSRRFDKQEKPT